MILIRPSYMNHNNMFHKHPNAGCMHLASPWTRSCMRRGQVSPCNQNRYNTHTASEVYKDEQAVTLSLDLPGVKLSDIKVQIVDNNSTLQVFAERKMGDRVTSKHSEQYFINNRNVETSNISAQFEDGVLTIRIPVKTPSKPVAVTIEPVSPPENATQSNDHFVVFLDVPGMKVNDLNLKIFDDFVIVQGQKENGNHIVKFCKKIFVDEHRHDTSKLNAYLNDGVLTIMAPPSNKSDTSKDNNKVKCIAVSVPRSVVDSSSSTTDEEVITTATEGSTKSGSSNEDKDEKVIVETVDENEEWVTLA